MRSRWIARWRSASSATRSGSMRAAAGSSVVMRTSVSAAPARAWAVNPPSVQAAADAVLDEHQVRAGRVELLAHLHPALALVEAPRAAVLRRREQPHLHVAPLARRRHASPCSSRGEAGAPVLGPTNRLRRCASPARRPAPTLASSGEQRDLPTTRGRRPRSTRRDVAPNRRAASAAARSSSTARRLTMPRGAARRPPTAPTRAQSGRDPLALSSHGARPESPRQRCANLSTTAVPHHASCDTDVAHIPPPRIIPHDPGRGGRGLTHRHPPPPHEGPAFPRRALRR